MFMVLDSAIPRSLVAQARQALGNARFVEGSGTAGAWNRGQKKNCQLPADINQRIAEPLLGALFENRDFQLFAFPLKATTPTINMYRDGGHYGPHHDNPLQSGVRADLSYTLFLSDPSDYEGGELHVDFPGFSPVKLEAGSVFVYSAGLRHWVSPVERGRRVAMVGWVQSMIRDGSRRRILRNMNRSLAQLFEDHGRTSEFEALTEIESALVHMWAET